MVIIPIRPFLLDVSLHAPCQPAFTHRDPGGKPSGVRAYCPSLKFSQSTLDDSGHNRGGPLPGFLGYVSSVGAHPGMPRIFMHQIWRAHSSGRMLTLVSLLPRCTWTSTKRHSSPVEAVLTGSEAALLGLIEISRSPRRTQCY